jgi:hypothetical protein
MTETWNDFITEVRERKAKLLEVYGGIDGLLRHQEEDRLRLEEEGWHFETPEEFQARTQNRKTA